MNASTNERPTVLVVDDTPANLSLLSGLLRDHYRIKREQEARAAEALKRQAAEEKIGRYKAEQERRTKSPFGGLDPSTGTLEGAAGFRDR